MTPSELDELEQLYLRRDEWDQTDRHEVAESLPVLLASARFASKCEAFLREHGDDLHHALDGYYDVNHYETGKAPQEVLESLLREVPR